MSKRNRRVLVLVCMLLAATLVLCCAPTFARYLEMITGDQAFQVKAMNPLEITQQWTPVENGYTLTFTAKKQAKNCRVFLAVSQGVTDADLLEVSLADPLPPEGEGAAPLPAVAAPIAADTPVYTLFGPGTIFRFMDADTGLEKTFDLSQGSYTLFVRGLDAAAQQTSLIRFFVENIPD